MADIKISQLGAAIAVNDSDLLPIVSNGSTLKAPSILANLVLCHLQHLPPKVLRCALVASLLLLFLCLLLERHPAERAKTHACLLPMGGFHGVHPSPGWNVTTRDTSNAKSSWDVSSS